VDVKVIWRAVENDLPPLRQAVEAMRRMLDEQLGGGMNKQ
jgi:uncharacterized protein with HEPN domain